MRKEIRYSGYFAAPSEYDAPDGQLGVALNIIPEDGACRPIRRPPVEIPSDVLGGRKCIYIHKVAGREFLILKEKESAGISWIDRKDHKAAGDVGRVDSLRKVTAVGNTLVCLADSGLHYFLWKETEKAYLPLGSHLPELPLSFGLRGEMVRSDAFTVMFDNKIGEADIFREFSDGNRRVVTEKVLAQVNKFIAEKSTKKGKFLYPFFVRYAYRLYDGSLTMHSAPCLMMASSGIAPQVIWEKLEGKGEYESADCRVIGALHTLDYGVVIPTRVSRELNSDTDIPGPPGSAVEDWKDIIASVDIFVSAPIFTYDQNGECLRFEDNAGEGSSFAVCLQTNIGVGQDGKNIFYQKNSYNSMYANINGGRFPDARVVLPARSFDAVREDIRNCSRFYLLRSLKIEELKDSAGKRQRVPLKVNEDYLQSLQTREMMSDDYRSHDIVIPSFAYVYNARLNIANLKSRIYDRYNMGALQCFSDGYDLDGVDLGTQTYSVFFFVREGGKEMVVEGETFKLAKNHPFSFLFYPNVNACKAVLFSSSSGFAPEYREVPLESHDFLNGAFWFGGWDGIENLKTVGKPVVSEDLAFDIPNKVYSSEVNNPFFFPLLGITTVGTGKILALAAATKALSEGQFGQFPLYAFTSEGVWALEVSASGTIAARQPVTRDVCLSPDSVSQIDSAVLFATDRGIMLISGSQAQCISDAVCVRAPFDPVAALPGFAQLMDGVGSRCPPDRTFLEFVKNARMLYDYVHQRIVIYAAGVSYAYVFSLKSSLWGMVKSDLEYHLNAYPEALAVDSSGNILNLSLEDSDESASATETLLVTRPLKFESPDVLKTVSAVIQRGVFRYGHVASALYASRDLFNWQLVWSSRDHRMKGFGGSPYRYFRIALKASLMPDESVAGASLEVSECFDSKIR